MPAKYAYSLNGEHYTGAYATRDDALAAAVIAARRADDSPQTVYVARRVPADPKAAGHARSVLANMTARAREEFGDAASSYLTRLSSQQIQNLDKSLELVIRGWLEHNELMPNMSKVEAIGEYSVASASNENSTEGFHEVHEIGASAD